MPGDRLKFRCYQCTQLLAVPPSKAGSIVACPKCKAELLIPAPAAETAQDTGTVPAPRSLSDDQSIRGTPRSNGRQGFDEPTPLFPPEIADLRPEDIRIEPSVLERVANATKAGQEPADESMFAGGLLNVVETSRPQPISRGEAPRSSASIDPRHAIGPGVPPLDRAAAPGTDALDAVAGQPARAETVVPVSDPGISIAAIDFEPPSIIGQSTERRTIREVVLPAGVVLAWSLFVLLSLGMAFIAGLLVGHYLWAPG